MNHKRRQQLLSFREGVDRTNVILNELLPDCPKLKIYDSTWMDNIVTIIEEFNITLCTYLIQYREDTTLSLRSNTNSNEEPS